MNCKDKRVLITGASSGIGAACAEIFAEHGAKLLLCARNEKNLQSIQRELIEKYSASVEIIVLDVSDFKAVENALGNLSEEWRNIDILVNNAGLALGLEKIHEANPDDWERMIDTNIKGLLYVSRHILKHMVKRNSGHVINIGSISSHNVYSGGVVYCATKHAENAISQGMKMDVHGTKIRVSTVDPGMVNTNFLLTRFSGDQEKASEVYKGMTPLSAEDVADAVFYCATRKPHVNILELIIYPTDQSALHLTARHTGD
jgi:3-hydroxy acid dehydrogenase/malonic semialdehyde reductase